MTDMSDECRAWVDDVWADMTDLRRIAATAFVLRHVSASLSHPGSFRYLIYDCIGLGHNAYGDVYLNGGMNVTNFIFEHGGKNEWKKHTEEDVESGGE